MVPDWSLRPAGVEDRAMLFRLREETMGKLVTELFGPWDDTVQWEYFDRWFRPESTRIVQVGGQDVGVIGLDDRGDETYVTRVEIHPEWQNRGIGTAVIERVMAEAAAAGTAVSLNVFSANPAWRLYERLGFSTVEDRDGRLTMRATPRRRPSTRRRETVTNRRVRRLASMTDRELIQAAYEDLSLLADAADAVHSTIAALDAGEVRVAERRDGEWVVNVWVKEAILLYFRITEVRTMGAGPFEYHDKIPTKTDLAAAGIRVVPPGTVRYGAFCEPGVVVMPGYVNIGAHVGSGTMVDTWATVGSCAQIGRDVHISGGVGIGGVLEPPNARPVIIEDGAFIGSRSIVVEGVVVESGAVLGANTTLSASIPIIDVTGDAPVEIRGRVPANAIVVPGARARDFPAGTYHLQSPLLIGYRTESTDTKTTLNEALRTFEVEV